jgi:DNA-binding response OmpR family regulator
MDETILLVEDDEIIRRAIEFRLKKEGYRVQCAEDGRKAMEYLQTEIPQLIITDLMMPFISGLEILSHVRGKLASKVPLIVLSAVGLEKSVLEAFELGADDFVAKPFSPNELIVRVKRLLNDRSK